MRARRLAAVCHARAWPAIEKASAGLLFRRGMSMTEEPSCHTPKTQLFGAVLLRSAQSLC
jgi:hypothetical protein